MLDNYSSNATTAKIRAKYAQLFTLDEYRDMAALRSVPEAAEFISRSSRFREAFTEVDPNTIHRGYLEELLYRENFETYIRLCKFQGLDKVPFFGFLIRRSEIECILSIINRINSSLDRTYLSDLPGYLIKYLSIPVMELSNSQTYEELVAGLKGTRYGRLLGRVPVREDGNADYTECELRLRTDYYAELLEQADKEFGGAVSDELKTMILREIDCRNIINAYRMKAYFGFEPDEIKRRSLKFYGIGKKNMERLYEAADAEVMMDMVNHTIYGKNSPDTDNIEVEINSVKIRRLRHYLTGSTYAPVSLYAFIQLCDIDVSNLVTIIEGIRYGVEAAAIEAQLITL
ncbi:V-type ATPase subunit [uncultured Ruminococcus sp.]|uniref:V-type ATPase subunit n=1 Tax=uncultured Ruminococcus sp. TaxID=165186 RepID=UPI0025F4D85B|nr:V-type ATPase subunit [uncultured Ruminococcus sp.]